MASTESKLMKALDESCIKVTNTKKPDDVKEWSWRDHDRLINGFNIFPGVVNQGNRGVCGFCSFTMAVQQEFNAARAWKKLPCNLRFLWENLLTKFMLLHGFKEGSEEEARQEMEKKLTTLRQSSYELNDALGWCFKYLGVKAEVQYEDKKEAEVQYKERKEAEVQQEEQKEVEVQYEDKKEAVGGSSSKNMSCLDFCSNSGRLKFEDLQKIIASSPMIKKKTAYNLGIKGYKWHEMLTPEQVETNVQQGKGLVATILAGDSFDILQEDEIYAWLPYYDKETRNWVDKPIKHGIVLVGNGNAGPTMDYEQLHPFLNSYGDKYAKDGVGSIFYKGLHNGFCLLDLEAEPRHVSETMSDLTHRPKLKPGKVHPIPPPRYVAPHLRGGSSASSSKMDDIKKDSWRKP